MWGTACAADPFSMLEGLSHPAPEPQPPKPGLDLDALYGAPAHAPPAANHGGDLLGGLGGLGGSPSPSPWAAGGAPAGPARPDAFGMPPLEGLLGGGAAAPAALAAGVRETTQSLGAGPAAAC